MSIIIEVAFLFIIAVVPLLLYAGLKRIVNPVPVVLPVLIAGIIIIPLDYITLKLFTLDLIRMERGDVILLSNAFFALVILFGAVAVVTAFAYLKRKMAQKWHWIAMAPAAFAGAVCTGISLIIETTAEGPWPHYFHRLPVFIGVFMDYIIAVFHLGDVVYGHGSQVYNLILYAGLFLEVFIVSVLVYALTCFLWSRVNPRKDQ
ncbi:MAG: hypothetical protein M0R30_00220 [Methanoregula sp.]|uniref:hypothetical protein n=1 Tax=Methanoregula sp. TaxID=2052170 RepID=UPI0025E2BD6E|nr:hypothetical protein [Methanoregula sp.]MCK9630044.1 hypothetical protein [Methanoregula sp.]